MTRPYIPNAFLKKFKDFVNPYPCELIEDPRISKDKDNKVSVRLANPYRKIEYRPFINNVVYIDDDKRHYNEIYRIEQKHMKKFSELGYAPLKGANNSAKLPKDQRSTMKQNDRGHDRMDVDPTNNTNETAN